jgi:hypothetical protein
MSNISINPVNSSVTKNTKSSQTISNSHSEFHNKLLTEEGLKSKNLDNGTDIAYQKAKEFEISSYSILWNHIFNMQPVNEVTGGGNGEEIFRGMLVNEMIKKIYQENPGPLANAVYENIKDNK